MTLEKSSEDLRAEPEIDNIKCQQSVYLYHISHFLCKMSSEYCQGLAPNPKTQKPKEA